MKILYEVFETPEQAQMFWDNSVYEMLDIACYLADNGLIDESKQFCNIFADLKTMGNITRFKFNFSLIKKFLGVPDVFADRNKDVSSLLNGYNKTEKNQELKTKFDDVMSVLYKELDVVSK